MIGRFRQPEPETVELKGFDDFDLRLGDVMRGERATLGKSLLDVQRELKIKATYIAAIENADPSAFETPGFIAGYVRSYARYLELDPDWAFKAFCVESNFETAHGMSEAASSKRKETTTASNRDPFLDGHLGFAPKGGGVFSGVEPSAIGSVCVLFALIGLIGYGGYSVLNEVQKVQVVPVDQAPQVVADIDPLDSARPIGGSGDVDTLAAADAPDNFDRLYRPRALDVPVMIARDGPIANLDPREMGSFAGLAPVPDPAPTPDAITQVAGLDAATDMPDTPSSGVQVVADAVPQVMMVAVRPSWVRVRAADGSTIYEQTMQEGDTFVLPATEEAATLRTGNSGAIYFNVNGVAYGPAGDNGAVTGNLALNADTLTETFQIANIEADQALARVVAELKSAPTPPVADADATPE